MVYNGPTVTCIILHQAFVFLLFKQIHALIPSEICWRCGGVFVCVLASVTVEITCLLTFLFTHFCSRVKCVESPLVWLPGPYTAGEHRPTHPPKLCAAQSGWGMQPTQRRGIQIKIKSYRLAGYFPVSRVHTLLSQEVKVSSQVSFHKAEEREWEIARFGACRLLSLDWVWVSRQNEGRVPYHHKDGYFVGVAGVGGRARGRGGGGGEGRGKCKNETIDFVYLWSQSPVPQQTRLYPVLALPHSHPFENRASRQGARECLGKWGVWGGLDPLSRGLTETHSQWIRQRRELHKDATKSNRLGWLTVSDHDSTVTIILGLTKTTMPAGTQWVPYGDVCGGKKHCHMYILYIDTDPFRVGTGSLTLQGLNGKVKWLRLTSLPDRRRSPNQFSSTWYLCSRKSPYALHPDSQVSHIDKLASSLHARTSPLRQITWRYSIRHCSGDGSEVLIIDKRDTVRDIELKRLSWRTP